MSGTDRDRIVALINDMFAAFAAGRPDAVEAALQEDCTVWDVFTPDLVRGPAARAEFHEADQRQAHERGELTYRLSDPLVDVWGDTAVARYLLEFSYAAPGALRGTIRITDVLRRGTSGWSIVHHHEGLVPAREGVPTGAA